MDIFMQFIYQVSDATEENQRIVEGFSGGSSLGGNRPGGFGRVLGDRQGRMGRLGQIFMLFQSVISQQIKMSFKHQQRDADNCTWTAPLCQSRGGQAPNYLRSTEDIGQKIKNSICLILQICDTEDLHRSTKFLAYSILVRYLSKNMCLRDDEFAMLILCSLRLSAKFNEAYPKSAVFDHHGYSDLLLPEKPMSEILQFQMGLFREMGFKIYIKTPYDFLEEFVSEQNLSVSFFNTVAGFLDFALTLVEMVEFTPQQIFVGCLVALKKSRNIENRKILGLIQQICGNVNKANQAGYNILQSWEAIINEAQQPAHTQ